MEFEEKPDYFVNQEPEKPAHDPNDPFAPLPDSGENDEKKPPHRFKKWLWWTLAIFAVILAVACYIRYFNPYIVDSKLMGYVTNVERRGIIFKTYEGEMITESSLTDTTRVYSRDFIFSVDDPKLALELQNCQGTGRQVTVTYKKYYGTLPWRGASRNIITAVALK